MKNIFRIGSLLLVLVVIALSSCAKKEVNPLTIPPYVDHSVESGDE